MTTEPPAGAGQRPPWQLAVALVAVLAAAFGAAYGIGDATTGDGGEPRAVRHLKGDPGALVGGTGECENAVTDQYRGAVTALAKVSTGGTYAARNGVGHDGETRYVEAQTHGDVRVSCTVTIDGHLVFSDEARHDSPDLSASAWQRQVRAAAPPGEAGQGIAVGMGSPAVSFPVEAAVRAVCRDSPRFPDTLAFKITAEAETHDPTLRQDLVTLDAAVARYVFRVARCTGPSLIPDHAPRVSGH
jgi:hypothetical protein